MRTLVFATAVFATSAFTPAAFNPGAGSCFFTPSTRTLVSAPRAAVSPCPARRMSSRVRPLILRAHRHSEQRGMS